MISYVLFSYLEHNLLWSRFPATMATYSSKK